MMKMNRTTMLLCAALLILSACSSIKNRVDPDVSQTLLDTKQIKCNQEFVRVLGMDGGVKISRGESKEIYVDPSQNEVVWFCENNAKADLERTDAPAQTNRLVVSRSQSDDLTMQFYRQTPPPSSKRTLLKVAEEECSSNDIRFVGVNGDLEIWRDQSKEISIAPAAGEVVWYCEAMNGAAVNGAVAKKSSAPEQANLVIVTRPLGGNSVVMQFFRKQ
jgi:hypothetical protein